MSMIGNTVSYSEGAAQKDATKLGARVVLSPMDSVTVHRSDSTQSDMGRSMEWGTVDLDQLEALGFDWQTEPAYAFGSEFRPAARAAKRT
jgi:hypothetical protein